MNSTSASWTDNIMTNLQTDLELHCPHIPLLIGNYIDIYINLQQVVVDGLREIGHNISIKTSASCVVQGIQRLYNGDIVANSDYRKGGAPDGYWRHI